MPSHRKTKRKKKQNKHDKSGGPRPPRTTKLPVIRVSGAYECPGKERQNETRMRLHEGQKKLARTNFYIDNGLIGRQGCFFPDVRSAYNNERRKFMVADYQGADDYDFAIYSLLCSLEIPEDVLPPIEMQEVPGGFCINPKYADTIESLHDLARGGDPAGKSPGPKDWTTQKSLHNIWRNTSRKELRAPETGF